MTVKEIQKEMENTPFRFEKRPWFHPISGIRYWRDNHDVMVYDKYRIHTNDSKRNKWCLKIIVGERKEGDETYIVYKDILSGCTLAQAIKKAAEMISF